MKAYRFNFLHIASEFIAYIYLFYPYKQKRSGTKKETLLPLEL